MPVLTTGVAQPDGTWTRFRVSHQNVPDTAKLRSVRRCEAPSSRKDDRGASDQSPRPFRMDHGKSPLAWRDRRSRARVAARTAICVENAIRDPNTGLRATMTKANVATVSIVVPRLRAHV